MCNARARCKAIVAYPARRFGSPLCLRGGHLQCARSITLNGWVHLLKSQIGLIFSYTFLDFFSPSDCLSAHAPWSLSLQFSILSLTILTFVLLLRNFFDFLSCCLTFLILFDCIDFLRFFKLFGT